MDVIKLLQAALKLADLAELAITQGGQAASEYRELKEKMRRFSEEQRDPSVEEFHALMGHTDELTERLNKAAIRHGG